MAHGAEARESTRCGLGRVGHTHPELTSPVSLGRQGGPGSPRQTAHSTTSTKSLQEPGRRPLAVHGTFLTLTTTCSRTPSPPICYFVPPEKGGARRPCRPCHPCHIRATACLLVQVVTDEPAAAALLKTSFLA